MLSTISDRQRSPFPKLRRPHFHHMQQGSLHPNICKYQKIIYNHFVAVNKKSIFVLLLYICMYVCPLACSLAATCSGYHHVDTGSNPGGMLHPWMLVVSSSLQWCSCIRINSLDTIDIIECQIITAMSQLQTIGEHTLIPLEWIHTHIVLSRAWGEKASNKALKYIIMLE